MMSYLENTTDESVSENSLKQLDNTLENNRILQMIMQKKYVVNDEE